MGFHPKLRDVLDSIRPALEQAHTTEADRAQFLYDLIGEVYDYVKYDLHGPTITAPERSRIASIANAALPPANL